MTSRARVLLADDDPDFRVLVSEAARQLDPAPLLHLVAGGDEVLTALDAMTAARGGTEPDELSLIVLDVRMGGRSGLDTLRALKAHDVYRSWPVVMLSDSLRAEDVRAAYRAGAAGYVAKPDGFAGLVAVLESLVAYWHRLVLPPYLAEA